MLIVDFTQDQLPEEMRVQVSYFKSMAVYTRMPHTLLDLSASINNIPHPDDP